MPENSTFADWLNSPYYQLLYHKGNQEKWQFIEALAGRLKPESGSKILHAGCGTGEYAKAIANLYADVTGIDLSFEAIRKAKEFEKDNLHFYQHDMRLPFWINYFNYAFNLFTSFGYFKTLREHDNSIRVIAQSLQAEGLFVMDYINVHYEENHLLKIQEKTVGPVDFRISAWQEDESFIKQIQVKEEGSVKYLFTEKLHKFSLGDFTDMFAYQGLQIQEVFGDYHFSDYDINTSPRLVFLAKKIRR